MSYTKTTWRNNQAPAINADNLNHMEQGIESAHNQIGVNTSNIESLTTQVQNNATNIASEISARQTTDSSLQSQIDQLVAPTGEAPTPAEIENARIGDDGVTYDTLGNAIRKQFSDVKSALNDFENDISVLVEPINWLNPDSVIVGYNRPWNNPSALVANADKVTYDFLPVEGGELIYLDKGNLEKQTPDNFVEWDINKTVLVSNADCPRTLNANTKYLSISMAKTVYDAWKNTLQLEYDEMREFSSYFKPYYKLEYADEIVNGRIGTDGKIYNSIGEANRTQFSNLESDIDDFESNTAIWVEPINILNPDNVKVGYNRPWNRPESLEEDANKVTIDFIPVKPNKLIYFDRGNLATQGVDNIVEFNINKQVIKANGDNPRTLDASTAYISVSLGLASYNAWKNTLQIEYETMKPYTPYFDSYWMLERKANSNCLSVAHQGYSNDGKPYGYSKIESYINASRYGFDYGETDLVFSSDEVAMCCHDASFVDATSGTTIVIADHTASELQTYDYYGGTLATLDEVIKTCKENGIGLVIDHVTEADSGTRFADVMATVSKYQMQDNVIWLVGRESMINSLKGWYKKVKIYIPLSSKASESGVVSLAQRIKTDYNEIGLSLNADVYSTNDIITLVASLTPDIHIQCWTVDNFDKYKEYLPYVSAITSNRYSTSLIGL